MKKSQNNHDEIQIKKNSGFVYIGLALKRLVDSSINRNSNYYQLINQSIKSILRKKCPTSTFFQFFQM